MSDVTPVRTVGWEGLVRTVASRSAGDDGSRSRTVPPAPSSDLYPEPGRGLDRRQLGPENRSPRNRGRPAVEGRHRGVLEIRQGTRRYNQYTTMNSLGRPFARLAGLLSMRAEVPPSTTGSRFHRRPGTMNGSEPTELERTSF